MLQRIVLTFCLWAFIGLSACGGRAAEEPEETGTPESSAEEIRPTEEEDSPTIEEDGDWFIVDANGIPVVVDGSLALSDFCAEDFAADPETGRVSCQSREALTGVDVSSHQGEIDWTAVAGDGIDFAVLRIGYRGYTRGGLNADETFDQNFDGARANGLAVGVYFFSQATTVAEAEEEADLVLTLLDGREPDLPVIFDWEEVSEASARTDGMAGQTVTACAAAFCARIEEAGLQAGIYCNSYSGYLIYDLSPLQDVCVWYAEYGDWPEFAYAFDFWQYAHTGRVAGIDGNVDLDLYFPS